MRLFGGSKEAQRKNGRIPQKQDKYTFLKNKKTYKKINKKNRSAKSCFVHIQRTFFNICRKINMVQIVKSFFIRFAEQSLCDDKAI